MRILHAAAEEFARHGFGGARVARIAKAAKANKERLYHYFGNKEQLFAAALDDAMRQIVEAEPFAADDLGAYVAAMVNFHRRHPTLIRLLLAEARYHRAGPLLHHEERIAHYAIRVAAVRRAQQEGAIRSDVDPKIIVYVVLALVVTAHALPQLTQLILGTDANVRLQRALDVLLSPVNEEALQPGR
ncbi:MAG TPA: TetR family transcriptional regulator [Acidimicrobiales bacterium]|nr:TetR family transcriptional regulator [Acidimicrobiales bacterium]